MTAEVRTRFAPSPTGMLHLGSARTALFNYLFAWHYGGEVILRVEDTDRARSTPEFEQVQLEDLAWLGITFDEGPYRQSERGELYAKAIEDLAAKDLVYETADEDGRRALYFRPPERQGSFRDGLRGDVQFSRVDDFVVRKSDGTPSYNFAAVVDDVDMVITHVIRGEEHLSNTARQTLLYRALGEKEPVFLHLGLILGQDGKKLSKRNGDASVVDYRWQGYLPEALINYLALLGWNHPEGLEDFRDLAELSREWDPSRLGASPAAFDPDRLVSINARHIRRLPTDELRRRTEPILDGTLPAGREPVAVEAMQEEMHVLSDAPRLLMELVGSVDPDAFVKELPGSSAEVLGHVVGELDQRAPESLEDARNFVTEMRAWAKENGVKSRDLLHPLRLALTGRNRGPEMAYLFAVLGPDEARVRIERAREAILKI
ncbi:MAG: glutamate--tRNA ligase [Rubrobacter sp.]|nr:glutamate--tRNA ligase [Rubrobacter sp.]